jgi:hypothetical protein
MCVYANFVTRDAGEPLKEMVLGYAKVNSEASLASTTAIGAAAESVVKAVGSIIKELEMSKRKCVSDTGAHAFIKVSDNPAMFMCSSCGNRA